MRLLFLLVLGIISISACTKQPAFTTLSDLTYPNTEGSAEPHWAFTVEGSLIMLQASGVQLAIIGHSERRQLFGETDAGVNTKPRATLAAGLTPIVCVGETLAERESGHTFGVLDRQIGDGLAQLTPAQGTELVVAYEPVWAIGSGRTPTVEDVQAMHAHMRATVSASHGTYFADQVRLLYGGSVKPGNASELMGLTDVDGALVGGASLVAGDFLAIAGHCS